MMHQFSSQSEFIGIIERSQENPIILMKHSNTCPISANAFREITKFSDENSDMSIEYMIVQDNAELKEYISNELDVEHESPQVIILRNRKSALTLNHYDITSAKLEEYML